MQHNYVQSPFPGPSSPRPPISKFYQPPSPGWPSPATEQQNFPGIGYVAPVRSTESLPSLPLRPLPSPAALAPPLRTNQPSSPGGGGHTWQLPGPPPSAPPSSHVQNPTYNPQTYGLMPSVQHLHEGRSWNQNGQAVKPDASKWGLNYNPNYAQNMDHSSKPLLPPRPSSATGSGDGQYQTPSNLASQSHHDQYRLQPVAYNPNNTSLVADEVRNSWQEGDDSEYVKPKPLEKPPRRPPKVPPGPSGLQQILQAVPPHPVYSSEPPTHHYDPSTNDQDSNHSYQPLQPQQPQQSNDYPAPPTRRPPDPLRPIEKASPQFSSLPAPETSHPDSSSSRQRLGERLQKDSVSPLSSRSREQWPSILSQPLSKPQDVSPPKPANAVLVQDSAYGSSSRHQPEPEQLARPLDDKYAGTKDTNGTFYWHSPQSPAIVPNKEPTVFKNEQSLGSAVQYEKASLAPTSASGNANLSSGAGLYSASALGFGGPSDWEYFGDYEAEVIDDTALYTTKPKIHSSHGSAELAAFTPPIELAVAEQYHTHQDVDDSANSLIPTAESRTTTAITDHPLSVPHQERSVQCQDTTADLLHAPDESSEIQDKLVLPQPIAPVPENLHVANEQSSVNSIGVESDLDQTTRNSSSTDEYILPPLDFGDSAPASSHHEPVVQTESMDISSSTGEADQGEDKMMLRAQDSFDQSSSSAYHSDEHSALPEPHFRETESGKDAPIFLPSITNETKTSSQETQIAKAKSRSFSRHTVPSQQADLPRSSLASDIQGLSQENQDMEDQLVLDEQDHSPRYASNYHPAVPDEISGDESGGDIIISLQDQTTPPQSQVSLAQSTSTTNQHPAISEKRRRSIFAIELKDPYTNLDPWAKASLNRYVKMLREEAQAEIDEEKYKIFMTFTRRESRLRAVLYDVDEEPDFAEIGTSRTPLVKKASTKSFHPSVSKALPALPLEAEQDVSKLLGNTTIEPVMPSQSEELPQSSQDQTVTKRASSDESYVMIDSPIERSYSPGGRPIIARLMKEEKSVSNSPVTTMVSSREPFKLDSKQPTELNNERHSAGLDAPIVLDSDADLDVKRPERFRSSSVPLASLQGHGLELVHSREIPGRPVYTPFRYNEGRPYDGDKDTNRQSVYRPFSMLRNGSLRQGSLDSGIDHHKPPVAQRRDTVDSLLTARKEHPVKDSKVPVILEAGTRKVPSQEPALEETRNPPSVQDLVLSPLLTVLPNSSTVRPASGHIGTLRQATDSIIDEFNFIHKAVVAWDIDAKQVREEHERERHIRQGESEQRIDALFNDNEIGYGDISALESEFKRSEAARKAEEDRAEYRSFVAGVFDIVWARLHYEMDQLTPLYDQCTHVVADALAGKDMFEDNQGRVAIAPAMDNLLHLYQKLSIRHQKAFEAVLERDRRLKKTEVAPLYTLGNISKVKELEKRFEDAEKKAILGFCQQRDERANRLMDILDQNTLRGVGANQDYMESIMQAVRKIAMEVALGSVPEDAFISTDDIVKAETITTALARSSEQIVQTFHVADMLLNAADYEVSVANVKLTHGDAATFKRLGEEKRKEDQKLVRELEHRLALIKRGSNRTHDETTKLLSLLESNAANGQPSRASPAPADPDHETRLQKALEEAKQRNALKDVEANEFSQE